MPTFWEWLLAKGALPIQAQINPFPATQERLRRLRAKPVQTRLPAAGRLAGQPLLPGWHVMPRPR